MYTFLLIVQVALAIGLIVLVLMQQGKGADAGAAFGSGASATVFGARGAGNFLSRTTGVLATLFFANSLLLSTPLLIGDRKGPKSVAEQIAPPAAVDTKPAPTDLPEAPAAPKQSAPADVPAVPAAPAASDNAKKDAKQQPSPKQEQPKQ